MIDTDPIKVLGRAIRDALDTRANDFQGEARAVVAAIRADTQQGAALRLAVLGLSDHNPALWDRLDRTPATSAQMIEWHAPHTAALLRERVGAPPPSPLRTGEVAGLNVGLMQSA